MKDQLWNDNWRFTRGATGEQTIVTLPHDAILNTGREPNVRNYFLLAGFQGGDFCYEKTLALTGADRGKTFVLELEGCYCMTRVYVNDTLAAEHPYGYTPIQVELGPYLAYDGADCIRVEVSIPREGHGRWYTGGGIYRPVHLYVGGEAYIDLYGLKITTLSHAPAVIRVDLSAHGGDAVRLELLREGKTLQTAVAAVAEGRASCTMAVENALLWSAETPNLYEMRAVLLENGREMDRVTEEFGIRTIATDPARGLLINGEAVFLRGGCIHNDNGVIGVVNNDATELHRAKILKKTGFNAIRSAHHPMSRSLMKAFDRVGMYVMDEAFDYWYRAKGGNPYNGPLFLEHFRSDTALMAQDAYNHPCVIMYSIGNEIPEAGGVKGVRVGRQIVDALHGVDTSRPTVLCPSVHWLREYLEGTPYLDTDEDQWLAEDPERQKLDRQHYMKIFMGAAFNPPDSERDLNYPPTFVRADEDATKNLYPYLDVAGYNYYEDKYATLHELHPERVLLGTETRGELLVDTMRFARTHPYLIGDFIWTLQDHLGEVNCCGIHYDSPEEEALRQAGENPVKGYPWLVNYCGSVDLIGTILPANHRYEFAWGGDKHGIYLASQPPVHGGRAPKFSSYRWTDTVEGWTYEGCEGQKTFVDVYTDAAEAAVLVNGAEVGRSKVVDYFAKIPCVYQPGELTGVGYDEQGRELYRTTIRTAGADSRITLKPDRTALRADGQDFCFVEVTVTDKAGNLKLLPEHRISVSATGPVVLQGFGSAYHKNEEKYDQPVHTTYLGRLLAVVRSTGTVGQAVLRFSAEGLEDAELTLALS